MDVKLASRVGTSSLLVDLVSNDSGDVTLVTGDGKVTTNRLLLFLSMPSLEALDCSQCCDEPVTFLLADRTSAQVRRALSFLVQCGDAGPLLNIMGVYHKQDVETDQEDGQVYHKQGDGGTEQEEGQVKNTAPPSDEVQKSPHSRAGVSPGEPVKKAFNNWQNEIHNLQNQISEDLLPNFDKTTSLSAKKQKTSSLGFSENSHSDFLDKHIDNAINAVMGEKNPRRPTTFTDDDEDDDATGLIEDVKLEQEESNLVEFFGDPENSLDLKGPENSLEKKFVKANRRVYTLEKSLLRANRRVYNLPVEVKEKLIWQNPSNRIDFTQTSHGGTLMLMDGYMFTGRVGLGNHRRDADELFIIWSCLEVKSRSCRTKLTTRDGQFVVTWNEEHNHASNEEGFKQRKAKTDLINAIFTSGKSVAEFFGPIPIDVDKAGQLARRIKMLKKENRLLAPQQSNQRLTRVGGSKLEEFKVDELVRICGLSEKSRSRKLEEGQEEPPRGRAKELPDEEKALMVEQNPGNRLEFGVNQQGGPTLLLDGFMYQVARVRAPISTTKSSAGDPWHWMSWKCKDVVTESGQRKRSNCTLHVNFTSGRISRQVDPSEHTHAPNDGEFHKIQAKRALLTKIIASGKTAHTYARENNLPREMLTEAVVNIVRKARHKNGEPSLKPELNDRSAEDPMFHLRLSLQNQKARKWKEKQRQKKKEEEKQSKNMILS